MKTGVEVQILIQVSQRCALVKAGINTTLRKDRQTQTTTDRSTMPRPGLLALNLGNLGTIWVLRGISVNQKIMNNFLHQLDCSANTKLQL